MAEKIQLNYLHERTYNTADSNIIGATTDTTGLRTVPTPAGTINYVRKFGIVHTIKNLTNLSDPGVANLTWAVKTVDGTTTYGTRANGGAYTDIDTTATLTAIRLEAIVAGGSAVLPTSMTITDADFGALTVALPAETIADGDTVIFYISAGGSSYYDILLNYGGARHTPVSGSSRYSYFDIGTAYTSVLITNNDDAVEILDSEIYDEQLDLNLKLSTIYSTAGQTPTITSGVGARVSREVSTQYNNATAIYFNESGLDANAGTWQDPKLTFVGAVAARATEDIVYGGSGATATGGSFIFASITASYTFESDYGYIPTFDTLTIGAANAVIRGLIIDPEGQPGNTLNSCIEYTGSGTSLSIFDCTIQNADNGLRMDFLSTVTNDFKRNIISNCSIGLALIDDGIFAVATSIENNIIFNCAIGISISAVLDIGGSISNNIIYNCSSSAILFTYSTNWTISQSIINNTINDCLIGMRFDDIGASTLTDSATIQDCIISNSGYSGIDTDDNFTIENFLFFGNTGIFSGVGTVTNTNPVYTEPKFCRTTSPFQLGISADSGAYRAGISSGDIGALLRVIEINEDTIELNGLKIDGQTEYNNAIYILDTADHTGFVLKWCDLFDFQGIGIDLYDNDADTDATINNNKIYNNGNGLKLSYGGNSLTANLFYFNTIFNVWSNYTQQTFLHNVFFGGSYGVYLESNSAAILIKNCILDNNSTNGVFSEISIDLLFCCITSSVNSNVDISSTTNIFNNPLFMNITAGSENFHLKKISGGFIFDSPCTDAASDGKDIGAYDQDPSVNNDDWKKYTLYDNPVNLNELLAGKGVVTFETAVGSRRLWAKSSKIRLPLQFGANQFNDETMRKTLRYITTLIQSRANALDLDNTKIRFHYKPTAFMESGTGATVTPTTDNISDVAKTWVVDEWKGYHVGVKYTSGIATGTIAAAGKTLTVAPVPSWTVDEWIGYYFYYLGYYYYIQSNTASVLTLSDPNSTLTNAAVDWAIEKYFKILSNSVNSLCVTDDDSELVAGTYDYYIDFIECRVIKSSFQAKQSRFNVDREADKNGYILELEEI